MKFELGEVVLKRRGRRSHWVAEHATYFLTFNLHDAVPRVVRRRIEEEADAHIEQIRRTRGSLAPSDLQAVRDRVRKRLDGALDAGHGAAYLHDPSVAEAVCNALAHFDEQRYTLLAWCVMPTHVHVVATLADSTDRVIHSWKTYSARAANQILKRSGPFWQAGYHDRCIRDSRELANTVAYVANNPAAAGLFDWRFVRVYDERLVER